MFYSSGYRRELDSVSRFPVFVSPLFFSSFFSGNVHELIDVGAHSCCTTLDSRHKENNNNFYLQQSRT